MRGNRRSILVLIEQRPRTVRELAALTNMTVSAIYEALREYKSMGIVHAERSSRVPAQPHGSAKVYAMPGTDMSAFA
jgi:DNA-binding transcriptional ArsR family regulator